MKKLMVLIGIVFIANQFVTAQAEAYSYSDVHRLTNLYDEIQSSPSAQVCYPWASTLRLVNIKENNQAMTDILSYENLWIALHETCLKDQRSSTRLDVELDKRGRIVHITRNGLDMDVSKYESLLKMKFKKHRSAHGKVINIFTSIG